MSKIFLAKYGEAVTIPFSLFQQDGKKFRKDAVHAVGDTYLTKNEGAEANTTNGFVDEGTGYSITLTAIEMQAARVHLLIEDQTATQVWLDTDITIMTIGHPSAQFPNLGLQTGDSYVRIGENGAGLTNIDLPDQTMNITGNLSGSVGSVTNPVTTDTDSRNASKADVSNLDVAVSTRATQASVDDVPNNAEFNARTLPSDDYFNPSVDTVNLDRILGTVITETNAGDVARSLSFFYDVNPTTTKTVNDVGVAGAGLTAQQVWEYVNRTLTAGTKDSEIDSILVDTNEIQGKLPTNNIMGSTVKTPKDGEIDAIKAVTDNIPNGGAMTSLAQEATLTARTLLSAAYATVANQITADGKLDSIQLDLDNPDQFKADVTALALETTVNALNNISTVEVKAQIDNALTVDTHVEPGRIAPTATPTFEEMLHYLYKSWRNKKDSDGITEKLYNDAGTTVDQQRGVSESAGIVTKEEMTIGT